MDAIAFGANIGTLIALVLTVAALYSGMAIFYGRRAYVRRCTDRSKRVFSDKLGFNSLAQSTKTPISDKKPVR
jgi:hypothetical protein